MFGAEETGVETAEVAFLSETQYMKDFLNSIDGDGSSKGTYLSYTWRRLYRVKSRVYAMTMFLRQVSRTQRLDM